MTPTTEDVRESYTYFRGTIPTVEHAAEFDAWLNSIKAVVWAEGAYSGYEDALADRETMRNPYVEKED